MTTGLTLRDEQAAFDAKLDELLRTHPGQYVLFKNGEPAGAAIGAQPKPALERALGLADSES